MSSERQVADSTLQDAKQLKQGASNAISLGKKASEARQKYEAAKKATDAAGTAAKAATKAASGNVAGAAVDVAKSDGGKVMLIVSLLPVLFVIFTMVLFLYALPTMIFEGVQSYKEEVDDHWNEVVASSSSESTGKFKAFFMTGGKLAGDLFGKFAEFINLDIDENDSFSETDSMVTYDEEAEKTTLKAKRSACTKKINQRIDIIASDVKSSVNDGAINSYFRKRFDQEYGGSYRYDSVEINVNTVYLTDPYASEILSFYTVQTGGNISDIKVSELLYWLGQKTTNEQLIFKLGDQVDVSITAWNGRFLPQYLMEQKRYEKVLYKGETVTDFESMQCSAADLLIAIDSEDFATLEPIITPVPETHTNQDGEEVTVTYYHVQWVVNIKIGCRDPHVLCDMAGLWDGSLHEEQDVSRLDNMAVGVGNFPLYSMSGGDTTLVSYSVAEGYDASPYVEKGLLSWPIPGAAISSKFGWRNCPFHGWELHTGVDLRATMGTPIQASGDGTVVQATHNSSLGNYVTIHHGNGIYTSYYHMSKRVANVGQAVSKGDIIGYVGATGDATGPHLHFVLMVGGINYLNSKANTNIKDPVSVIVPR